MKANNSELSKKPEGDNTDTELETLAPPLVRLAQAVENHNQIDKELLLAVLSSFEARLKDLEG